MSLADEFRTRAKEHRDAANSLIDASAILTDRNHVAATVGHVTAQLYTALADMEDYHHRAEEVESATARRRAILERNDAIRKAAARGDWDEFDRLTGIESDASGSTSGGDAEG
jgi:hypothetical protein